MFVLPQHSTVFPLLPTDLQVLSSQASESKPGAELDFSTVPKELQIQIKCLSSTLNSCLEQFGLGDDVYAIGATSRLVASELASLPWAKTRRKSSAQKCSLLLVDRSLDVAEATSQQSDTLLDRIVSTLPHLPGHHNDVAVNMAPICSVVSNPDNTVIVPGCLAHSSDASASALLNKLATIKQKEALLEVHRQVVEAASRESLPVKLSGKPGRVTADQIQAHIDLFKGKYSSIKKHSGLLQIAQATVSTLSSPDAQKSDNILGLEKGLLTVLDDEEGDSPLTFINNTLKRDLEQSREERLYCIDDIFVLLLYVYSLADSSEHVGSLQEERLLRQEIVKCIVDDGATHLPDFLKELVGDEVAEGQVRLVVQDLFERLKALSSCRKGMEQFSEIYDEGSITSQATRKPILHQVMASVFDPSKPDLLDVECKSTGFRDKLKSGFGLFMSVSKPRPGDQPVLIVFVIGGVTSTEVRKITEAAAGSDVQVLVGSTSLIRPKDLLYRILVQDNLHPNN